jgi:ParB family transcriptional regulator, chromosome partitioning protein
MSTKRPTLGRGLADLLGQARTVTPTAAPAAAAGAGAAGTGAAAGRPPGDQLAQLPVELLQRGRYQPRADMREDTLDDLAESIRRQGVIQPVVVRPIVSTGAEQRYEIIAGERRWRAAQRAGLTEVPAIIRHVPDEAAVAMALIENIQREDLNPLEEARAFERLIKEFKLTHQQVAEAVGRSRAGVSNLLRLLELAPEVCDRVERRELDMGHARALLGLENKLKQIELAAIIVKKGLSVRETEAAVRRLAAPGGGSVGKAGAGGRGRDPNLARLEGDLSDKLGAQVRVEAGKGGAGKLVISYHSLDELDGILSHIQ